MTKKLYKYMDWASIEGICYGECVHPEELLGPHNEGNQTLLQCFFPGAKTVTVIAGNGKKSEEVKAEKADDAGYFAALLTGKDRKDYLYKVAYDKDDSVEVVDPYLYTDLLKEEEIENFVSGNSRTAYQFMGAHMESHKGVKGCRFALWAPCALSVSVVGDFNDWNALSHPMMRRDPYGIYELFIPEAKAGDQYKYSILLKGNRRQLKADPFGQAFEESSEHASLIVDGRPFKWNDTAYQRAEDITGSPYNSYEVFLGNYLYGGDRYLRLKDRAKTLVSYVKEMGYTHIELTPFFDYGEENSMGYAPLNFFAVTKRFGNSDDFKYLVNEAHNQGIGMIMQWPFNCFDPDSAGLSCYDGSCLYEHEDVRKGVDARNGRKLFNYARPEVQSYLMSSLCYMIEEYHFDGIKFCDVASTLYLDYYRAPGQWVPNMYGGNENLDAIAFMKLANRLVHKNYKGVFTIAEDESTFPLMTTASHGDDNMGFDLTCNEGFNNNLLEYMSHDPYERKYYHDRLTLSSFYYTNEAYTIGLSQRHINYGKGGAIGRMPGDEAAKFANMKLLFSYNMFHPGKKKNIMGQEFGEETDFFVGRPLETDLLKNASNRELLDFVKALNHFYLEHPAFYGMDQEEGGFVWIHNLGAEDNILSFTRNDKESGESFFVVMNFSGANREKVRFGVPVPGRYKEVFNVSDADLKKKGIVYESLEEMCHGRSDSITLTMEAFSLKLFSFVPYTQAELAERARIKAELEAKRKEELRKKKELAKEKARIRKSLKEELERKFREAEIAIEKGSEKPKTVKKTSKAKSVKK